MYVCMYVSFGANFLAEPKIYRSEILFVLNANCVSTVSNELVLVASDINLFIFLPFFSSL